MAETVTENSETLTQQEIEERVAILKRLRDSLLNQRTKFVQYLEVLEHQEKDIVENDIEKLQYHSELEKGIVHEIFTFQKAVDPLEDMYRMAYPAEDPEMSGLKTTLEKMKAQVVERSRRNQDLLKRKMEEIRNEIHGLKKMKKRKSIYGGTADTSSMIDITT